MKVTLKYCCSVVGGDDSETIDVPDDITDSELEKMAEQFMWDNLQPEWWFEKKGKTK